MYVYVASQVVTVLLVHQKSFDVVVLVGTMNLQIVYQIIVASSVLPVTDLSVSLL
jgi:hypothetical protein